MTGEAKFFWATLAFYAGIADKSRLAKEDEAKARKLRDELHAIAGAIAKRSHDEPAPTLHEINRLLLIVGTLASLGWRSKSMEETVMDLHRARGRNKLAIEAEQKAERILKVAEEQGIVLEARGAASELKKAGVEGDPKTIRNNIKTALDLKAKRAVPTSKINIGRTIRTPVFACG